MLNKIRYQLTLWYSLGILVSVFLLLFLFYFSTGLVFYAQVNQTLKTHVDSLINSLEKDTKIAGCGCISPESTLLLGVLAMPGMPTAILDENGKIVKSSVDFIVPPNPLNSLSPQIFNATLADWSYRFLQSPIKNNNQVIGFVLMGHPIDAFLKTRTILAEIMIALFLLLIFPVIALGKFLAEKVLFKEKQFLTDMAHSLKTPLAVLQSQVEGTNQFDIDKDQILSGLQRISQAVNQTLETAYSQTNQSEPMAIDLNKLISELIEIGQHLGQKKGIKIIKNFPSAPLFIKGNKQNLAKAILSVLENTINYGKSKGITTVSLAEKNNQAIITIADNGMGIDNKDLPFIFDRFYRGKQTKALGHGLGLSIAKNIIENMEGQISLKSQKDKGTTIIIKLPQINPS